MRDADPTAGDPVVAFYRGGGGRAGRTLDEIRSWSDDRLERPDGIG